MVSTPARPPRWHSLRTAATRMPSPHPELSLRDAMGRLVPHPQRWCLPPFPEASSPCLHHLSVLHGAMAFGRPYPWNWRPHCSPAATRPFGGTRIPLQNVMVPFRLDRRHWYVPQHQASSRLLHRSRCSLRPLHGYLTRSLSANGLCHSSHALDREVRTVTDSWCLSLGWLCLIPLLMAAVEGGIVVWGRHCWSHIS